ncbi:hypothetical protein F4821DRAFT_223655 [Hypoxylon rubiginosum]|uniref:Uncharacterized protein n=1 Tax=Hypoxylon rubiginosum TaxID=110542 RepID=A0ACC0DJU3_9PEZI|nr:hypothetical protein F4821DRAFT_223655 [Hypoxylon rubiginosum]
MARQTSGRIGSKAISNKPAERHTKSFTIFGMLPLELRMIIWECAMDEPRIVQLPDPHFGRTFVDGESGYPTFLKIEGHLCQQVPKFFLINRESRQLALKRYTNRLFSIPLQWRSTTVAMFITSKDDIVVDAYGLYDSSHSVNGGTPSIRSLAIHDLRDLGSCVTSLQRLISDLATTKYRLGATRYRQGRHERLTRRATKLETRIQQLESQIEPEFELLARDFMLMRRRTKLDMVERWIVLLKSKYRYVEQYEYSDLVFVDVSELAPKYWKRQEENKQSEDPEIRDVATEALKLQFARVRTWETFEESLGNASDKSMKL